MTADTDRPARAIPFASYRSNSSLATVIASRLARRLETPELEQFATMQRAFLSCGGFVSAQEVTSRLRCLSDQPISKLARWIVSRGVVSIPWRAQTLMPTFQFDFTDMSIRPVCTDALAELRDVLNDWEVAVWFAEPNVWLNGRTPASLVEHGRNELVQAARADRFVARG